MDKFLKTATAAFFLLSGLFIFAASLPQDWTTVGHVKASWELRVSGFQKGDLCAYFVIGDRNDLLEGTTPPRNPSASLGEQDLVCWRYGVKNSTCVAFRVSDTTNFNQNWTLCLDASAGASSKLELTVTRIESSLPEGVQVKLLNADGRIVADFSSATESVSQTAQDIALGEYTLEVSYARPAIEVEIADGVELESGWNLIALPFDEILEAKINGTSLFGGYAVYRMDASRHTFVQVKKSNALEAGDGLWVYLPSGGTLTGKGECIGGKSSTIPERETTGWNCVGVVKTFNTSTETINPVSGSLSKGSRCWNAAAQRFVPVSGTPDEYVGYFTK